MAYTLVPTELIQDGAVTSAKLDTNIAISGTLSVAGVTTLATHLVMGDNDKIKIGTGGDLEIYHDASNSYIANSTGNLYIGDTNGSVHIQAKLNEDSIVAAADGAVTLYYDNAAKLATTSTGIDVTGDALASSSFQVDSSGAGYYVGGGSTGTTAIGLLKNDAGKLTLDTDGARSIHFKTGGTLRQFIDGSTGDISFYEDTGSTAKFFWDASAESLGIGTTSPQGQLHINTESAEATKVYVDGEANQQKSLEIRHYDSSEGSGVGRNLFYLKTPASNRLDIGGFSDGSSEFQVMTLLEVGNVGIGITSPAFPLDISGERARIAGGTTTTFAGLEAENSNGFGTIFGTGGSGRTDLLDNRGFISAQSATSGLALGTEGAAPVIFYTNGTTSERLRIDSSGNVGIGTSVTDPYSLGSTGKTLSVNSSNAATGALISLETADAKRGYLFANASNVVLSAVHTGIPLKFNTNDTERARIDSSGNLLVGQSSSAVPGSGNTVTGISIAGQYDAITISRADAQGLIVNRNSDGKIIEINKDGAAVGSIGAIAGQPYFTGATAGGFQISHLNSTNAVIVPVTATGANSDDTHDIGYTGKRFRNIILSGGVHLGGTGAANKLDDYEEGTVDWFTLTDGTATWTQNQNGYRYAAYTKIGNQVHVHGNIYNGSISGSQAAALRVPLPFVAANVTAGQNRAVGHAALYNGSSAYTGDYTILKLEAGASYGEVVSAGNGGSWGTVTFAQGDTIIIDITYTTS